MTSESRIDWSKAPIWLLAVAAFLAPLIGGTVATDATTLEPGYAPTMQAIFGGSEVPTLSHLVLAMLVCGAAIWILLTKRVIQAPMPLVAYAVLGLTIVVVASCLYSAFPALSFAAALEWIVYMIALLVAVGGVGRKHGPRTILGAVLGGCLILSLLAISEYFAQNDPTWRVFGTWQNPNALAGMLIIGFLVGAGLTMSHDRPMAIFGGVGTVACAFALALTQSKGAFLAAAIGLFALLAVTLLWMRGKGHYLLLLIRVAGCILALIALLAILRAQPAAQGGGTPAPLARVADASATQDQSSGFRLLLWKGAIELVKQHPFGWGIGAYRHESGRPGLTTQTQLAHNSYLQLAAETGVLGLALLLGLGVLWTIYSFKGASQSDPESLPLKIGVFAAVMGAAAHNGVDSDLYYFGTGFVFFLLLGLGMQLNADGVTPESVQPVPRWVAFALACCAPLGLLYFGAIEATKAHVRYHIARGEREPAVAGAEAATGAASADGDAWYLRALVAGAPDERLRYLDVAAKKSPSTRNLRALARAQDEAGKPDDAATTFREALTRDPNNLYSLKALFDLFLKQEAHPDAEATARRMIEVEKSPYFTIRALPELVPAETTFARRYLASRTQDPKSRVDLLEPAIALLSDYAARTVPNVIRSVEAKMTQGYAGETLDDAIEKMELGKLLSAACAQAYEKLADPGRAQETAAKAQTFEEALAKLRAVTVD